MPFMQWVHARIENIPGSTEKPRHSCGGFVAGGERSALRNRIAFISTMGGASWGGSEELWSRTALRLAAEGYPVCASLNASSPPHQRALQLIEHGIEVWFRPTRYPLWQKARRALTAPQKTPTALEVERFFSARPPGLVVFSDGGPFPPIELIEMCRERRLPFVTLGHANDESWWPDDGMAARYRTSLAAALRCYFVSNASRWLAEKQIGCELPKAEIVWNPFNVDFHTSPAWPQAGRNGELRFACVGRLVPSAKGQDVLFEALAQPPWTKRPWRLHLYGDGPMRGGLERLAKRLALSDRIVFEGHVAAPKIWASNHVLVMPSRIEGLPLAVVEAMLSGRPVVVTDVAGNAEIVEDGITGFLANAPTADGIGDALERFWARRDEASEIGAAASKRIRQLVPPDPVSIFSEKIKGVVDTAQEV